MIVGVFRVLGMIYARLSVYFTLPTFYVTFQVYHPIPRKEQRDDKKELGFSLFVSSWLCTLVVLGRAGA